MKIKSPVDILLDRGRLLQRSKVFLIIPLIEMPMRICIEMKQQKLNHWKLSIVISLQYSDKKQIDTDCCILSKRTLYKNKQVCTASLLLILGFKILLCFFNYKPLYLPRRLLCVCLFEGLRWATSKLKLWLKYAFW